MCCMNLLPPVGESIEPLDVDSPDNVASGKETAGRGSKVGSDICVVPDVLQTAVSVTTVVSEKWMERFVLNLDDLRSDVLDPAGGRSDVGSDVCVVLDPLRTAVSVRTVVDGLVCLRPGRESVCFWDECGGLDVRAGSV